VKAKLNGIALCCAILVLSLETGSLVSQQPRTDPQLQDDSDHDGLSDQLEQRILKQFAPKFMTGKSDCSVRPAEFRPGEQIPEVLADNGTIYGQAFPSKNTGDHAMAVELHYYHLWRRDCGEHGHALDTEHVAVLVHPSDTNLTLASWKALYWYAAAHEDTICDVSQIARASTLSAEDHGATVWISPGKHASYLNATLCQRGCGADRCNEMVPLETTALVNLGEVGQPANGSLFISSAQWPLQAKMSASNFPAAPLARLDRLPLTDIAWVNPGRHPAQGIIARSSSTAQALAQSQRNTSVAISVAESSTGGALSDAGGATGDALSVASGSTGGALQKSYRHTRDSLGKTARHVGDALHLTPKTKEPASTPQ